MASKSKYIFVSLQRNLMKDMETNSLKLQKHTHTLDAKLQNA